METTKEKIELPEDLDFINALDVTATSKVLIEKFAQQNPQTAFQRSMKTKVFSGKKVHEYIKEYGINEKTLMTVYSRLEKQARENGIIVEYLDLSQFEEDEFYENELVSNKEKHAETARSDGKTLVLEKDIERAGGIPGRMYDLLHLAYGHMVQWSTIDSRALLTKEEAWAIGYRNHEGSPDKVLALMAQYELEAGMSGVSALTKMLVDMNEISGMEKEAIIQYFTDYVYADSAYIIQHYRGNRHKFEEYFQAGREVPPLYQALTVPEYIKRQTVEIGLIRDKQK